MSQCDQMYGHFLTDGRSVTWFFYSGYAMKLLTSANLRQPYFIKDLRKIASVRRGAEDSARARRGEHNKASVCFV